MTAPLLDVRIRRPKQHERLLQELRDEAGFPTFRDGLLFAAALGVRHERREPFTETAGDPIRYETLTVPAFAEAFVSMLAANEVPDDPEVMDDRRLEERVRIFEEYAHGGLSYLQGEINVRHQPISAIVCDEVTNALTESEGAEAASVEELLGGVSW
ncbi:DNA phosphorothioation-associated protein 4 [Geodermatophilus dictyosporus]|uniref:DNA phosphorothioation-associated protein 4 n=1 Tax=Geodermatophilus dictyosporus TaxID=1523247 RepID=UPI000B896F50|nr:DNA phosphorothioation-associated protein 4 [Geodermatophilus dictyosporus]